MQETLHYLLMSDHLMVQKALLSCIKDTGLTLGQPKILDYLLRHDGAIQREIAVFCHIEPGSLTTILSGMEAKGYIERRADRSDRRSLHVYLTETGKQYADRLSFAFDRIEAEALRDFTEEEAQQLCGLLTRVYRNMVKLQQQEGADR